MSPSRAKILVAEELEKEGYSAADAESFEIVRIKRDETEDWPTYGVVILGTHNGKLLNLTAFGNGCGHSEIIGEPPSWYFQVSSEIGDING